MEASGVNCKEPEEQQINNCVAIFYDDEGKGGEDFRKEEQISSQTSICAQPTAMHSGTGHPPMVLL